MAVGLSPICVGSVWTTKGFQDCKMGMMCSPLAASCSPVPFIVQQRVQFGLLHQCSMRCTTICLLQYHHQFSKQHIHDMLQHIYKIGYNQSTCVPMGRCCHWVQIVTGSCSIRHHYTLACQFCLLGHVL